VPKAIHLAQKMGKSMGERYLLQRQMPDAKASAK
jgi:hypothetical protein